jgi:hypothetical protein
MSDNKSHHFVPQFLLRLFSLDGASVGLSNLRTGKTVTGASIKHQACRDWFYGRDGKAERALSDIEGAAATVLRRIINTNRPPKRYSDDHRILATFLLIQSARTATAAADADEMVNKLGKLVLRHAIDDPELLAALDDVTISLTEPAAEALRPAVLETPVILDLKVKLLRNISTTPFILGDHPAVKHNSLYRDAAVSVLGLANVGLQILLPISPAHTIVFYDEAAYTLGNAASNVIQVSSNQIVLAINELQWAAAHQNVYFRPDSSPQEWRPAPDRLGALRQDEHVAVDEGEGRIVGGRLGKIITVQTHRQSRGLNMPLFRNRIAALPLADVGTLPLRDPSWAYQVHRLTKALNEGAISPETFHVQTMPPKFLERIQREQVEAKALAAGDPIRAK